MSSLRSPMFGASRPLRWKMSPELELKPVTMEWWTLSTAPVLAWSAELILTSPDFPPSKSQLTLYLIDLKSLICGLRQENDHAEVNGFPAQPLAIRGSQLHRLNNAHQPHCRRNPLKPCSLQTQFCTEMDGDDCEWPCVKGRKPEIFLSVFVSLSLSLSLSLFLSFFLSRPPQSLTV